MFRKWLGVALFCTQAIAGHPPSSKLPEGSLPHVEVFPSADKVCQSAAKIFIEEVEKASQSHTPLIFILPTGQTPLPMYQKLVKEWEEGGFDLSHVVTFNMDEYVGLGCNDPQSYRHYMKTHFHGLLCDHLTEVKLRHFGLELPNEDNLSGMADLRGYLQAVRHDLVMRVNQLSPSQLTPRLAERMIVSSLAVCAERARSGNLKQSRLEELMRQGSLPSIKELSLNLVRDNHLWKKGIRLRNAFIPNGLAVKTIGPEREAIAYRDTLRRYRMMKGSRVVLFGGIGQDPAHIAFNELINEPAFLDENLSDEEKTTLAKEVKTRVVPLDAGTIKANSRYFKGDAAKVPKKAITIGFDEMIGPKIGADRLVILATGTSKAQSISQTFHGKKPSYRIPSSLLRDARGDVTFLVDKEAFGASEKSLSRKIAKNPSKMLSRISVAYMGM